MRPGDRALRRPASTDVPVVRAATDAYFNQRAQHSSIKKKYGQDAGGVDWETYRRDALNDLQGFGPTHVLEEAVDAQIASLRRFEKPPPKE